MNERLLDGINGLAGQSPLLDAVGRFAAVDGIYLVFLLATALGFRELWRNRGRGVFVGIAGLTALAVSFLALTIAARLVSEARPFVVDPDTLQLIPHAMDNSFPSDHATVAAVVAGVAALSWPRWAVALIGGAFLVGVARVFAGLHYPGDVLAGWVIGGTIAFCCWNLLSGVQGRRGQPTGAPM